MSALECDRRRDQRLFLAVGKTAGLKRGRRRRCERRRGVENARAMRVSGCWFARVAVFHAVGFTFDDDGLGAVQEPVGNRAVMPASLLKIAGQCLEALLLVTINEPRS